jgi:hypothetical protein
VTASWINLTDDTQSQYEEGNRTMSRIKLASVGVIAILSLVIVSGCGTSSASGSDVDQATSSLSEDQATEIADHALRGYNEGDYGMWSRNWTDAMTSAIKEKDFLAFRDQQMKDFGTYVSIDSAELTAAKTDGFILWKFTVEYENGQQLFVMTFGQDGDRVEGVRTESVS